MKASDICVGDWVNYSILNLKAKVFSVLGNHTIGIQFVDKNNKVEAIHGLLEEAINPIPLTEEILVKNGFKKESQTIDGDYCKYTLSGFVLNWCDTDGFWYQNGDITPNHVHTLQHLLRLCGVEKELII